MYKEYMLKFQWDGNENETFYFDTEEQMIRFVKENNIKVEVAFKLEQLCNDIFT